MEMGHLPARLAGFEDVTPIPQEDGDNPVVSIAYPHNCEYGARVGLRFETKMGPGRLAVPPCL